MSDAQEQTNPTTTPEPDNSPESWASAENEQESVAEPEKAPAEPEEAAPPLDPNEPEGEPEGVLEGDDTPVDDEPPEFWSAERKALWAKIQDPEIRAAIKGHVDEASKAINGKMEEAATARKAAEEAVAAEHRNRDQLAGWWKQNGPTISALVQGKWANVDWNQLAADNPAEYVRLKAQHDVDMGQLRNMQETHQREVQAQEQRQKQAHQAERSAEHAKLAKALPSEFGEGKAQATYDNLSKYLLDQGVPGERISNVYEEPIVKIVLKAYKYDQLQKKAKEVTNPKPAAQSATTTPMRVTPGATARSANPGSEAQRQAIQALKDGKRLTAEEAALAFR